jgi:CO/xanthine dehydrogenase FAD-binding subunit
MFAETLAYFANPLVRARATIGGNIADASPIADTVPTLLCMEATVIVAGLGAEREIPLSEFFTGPNTTVLGAHEVVRSIRVPVPTEGRGRYLKLGLRNGTACSVTSVGVWLVLDGQTVRDIRIACGGVAPTPVRARGAEKAFRGKKLEGKGIRELASAVQADIRPISDVRGSAEYRRAIAERLLVRAVRQAAGLPEE